MVFSPHYPKALLHLALLLTSVVTGFVVRTHQPSHHSFLSARTFNNRYEYKPITLQELQKKILANPEQLLVAEPTTTAKKGAGKRRRRRKKTSSSNSRYYIPSSVAAASSSQKKAPQYSDADLWNADGPHVLANTTTFAAVYKPAGWAVVGTKLKAKVANSKKNKGGDQNNNRIVDEEGDVIDFSEGDILALLTPEERMEMEGWDLVTAADEVEEEDEDTIFSMEEDEDEDEDEDDQEPDYSEYTELESQSADDTFTGYEETEDKEDTLSDRLPNFAVERTHKRDAVFAQNVTRPALVPWLQELGAIQGKKNAWKALAGATNVDDSGIVVIVPKKSDTSPVVTNATFVAVLGEDGDMNNGSEVMSTLRKGRNGQDVVNVVRFADSDATTCDGLGLGRGVRGDPTNTLDRRAARRLVHCESLILQVDGQRIELDVDLPDDIRILSDRRDCSKFNKGSFLGRESLRRSPHTNIYREINGEGDGYPGWTVDRYDKWLVVYHDPKYPEGPLPSIHDGYTTGVYYVDKSSKGSQTPQLMEGQPAPEFLTVKENGINYTVSLSHTDKQYWSTGIFLDQRPQRAWLAQHCSTTTTVLNMFCHAGAYSVAAQSGLTVNVDLNPYWLERLRQQLPDSARHDCIYGDCVEWMEKLKRRGEFYDIVILDPPSSSVGRRRRWTVKNDMAALVQSAAAVVRPGGLLWTTTNHAGIGVDAFARLCEVEGFRLEKVAPMPVDFPSVGPQPVKNLVWRRLKN